MIAIITGLLNLCPPCVTLMTEHVALSANMGTNLTLHRVIRWLAVTKQMNSCYLLSRSIHNLDGIVVSRRNKYIIKTS